MMAQCRICYCFALFLILNRYSTTAQPSNINYNSSANLSTTWNNTNQLVYSENIKVQPILLGERSGSMGFACGFYCNGSCTSYLFAIYIILTRSYGSIFTYDFADPRVVWSANRDYPVSYGATLNFTATGNLVLQDVNGSTVWTTNTTGKSVVGMNLTDIGNLVLFDANNSVVWQSFDHPTDCLLPQQRLFPGQQLIPSVSSTNWMAQKGLFSLQVTNESFVASVGSNRPQVYYQRRILISNDIIFSIMDGSFSFNTYAQLSAPPYMKFMSDGHLKVFQWKGLEGWSEVADLLTDDQYGQCRYPFICGRNALCSSNQCSCPISSSPRTEYFRAVNDQNPNQVCFEITPLTCNATKDHVFIPLKNVSLYTYSPEDVMNGSMEACKQACLKNCSCKAVVFEYNSNSSYGWCYLPSDLFSMVSVEQDAFRMNATTFIKVQNVKSKKNSQHVIVVITSIIGSFLAVCFITSLIRNLRPNAQIEEEYTDAHIEEEYTDVVPGLPTRFIYEELKTATENFSKKIGQGGFGSVFEGTLENDSKIAVKCLDGFGQVNKSFLAEVESIGSIDHVNLVRLRGFGAWKSQQFLVYDFMSNGSLDKWIYHGGVGELIIKWECRKKIIHDIAKGLAYLHEECTQKIIHLDIKPQNILLDNDFNAKVSDFGLSKLIDRDQSKVITTMRGTPGYMAPEWLSSVITEKVDVYSFGIVLLEILCGRRNVDRSQPTESWHLLDLFQKCCEQGMLLDIVDKYNKDMQTHGSEVVEVMKVASWCLQTNFTRRPSMSSVVKVLEGLMIVESNLDYNFTNPNPQNTVVEHEKDITRLLVSALSGPR